ncbi:NAD-dependent epimerase/dehydratase family protein [Actinomadura darangshiensis]|uniref:NAD-dependent epimerase/dehydratase family protein n=1 Tax=Actinomadura darangshiensis TaxID=705336 RepID=A0A4R5AXC6_9ACTN|nr:NAD(P)H-binding protein [Actinomadura darangshiensis]TDD77781.1 NAD-dependent epimerase/dehydratase family protein [Actinomadura darangshiensis]
MRLTVFGATGGTGVLTVRRALDAGHDVTAVVRDPAALPDEVRACAEVVQADVMDAGAIEETVKGRDAVLTAIGTRDGRAPTSVCADSTRAIIAAMRTTGTERFLLTSAAGLHAGPGDDPVTRFVVKPILERVLKHSFADMRAAEAVTRDSGLGWTIVRPPRLTNAPGKGRYRRAADRNVFGGVSIARADLAVALLDLAGDRAGSGHVISVSG